MKRFVDALQGQLVWDLRDYGRYEIINIYEDGWGYYVHVMIEGLPYTAAYDLNAFGVPPFIFVCIKDGFYRNRKDLLMIERINRKDILRLKNRFHAEAMDRYRASSLYGDFHHLGYLLRECGGYATAKILIRQCDNTDLSQLAYYGRLDLSLERMVTKPDYDLIFSTRDRDICHNRLQAYGPNGHNAIGYRTVYNGN